ncbi:hypothetical protein [Clostridium perfringens]|uniref:hypothetical protein n=1 Tax=Clostridium perfringens TaxID=1502 RepID=UPI00111E8BDC|nr:hypothetical protein [Clostridium perfringens]ELC8454742.1 hypothetical protein [Clostridium perfringens]MDK0554363.1 hypothetical protein [Clostridium perfringens]NGT68573.1 hypothetical protein [Clostridium perfringens]TPE14378.1 hypothetical protein FJM09_15865 [Clostridium perfringens]WVM62308.1 hypothetical protein V1657_16125 [Clostridium perfringens]
MSHLEKLEARREKDKKLEELRRELEKDNLFKANKKEPISRVIVTLETKIDNKITDYFIDNNRKLKEQYNINSRNKLMAYLLKEVSNNLDLIFKDKVESEGK